MHQVPAKAPKVTDAEFVVVREPLATRIAHWIAVAVVMVAARIAYLWFS